MKKIYLLPLVTIFFCTYTLETNAITHQPAAQNTTSLNQNNCTTQKSNLKNFCQLLGCCRKKEFGKKNSCHLCALHDSVVICCNLPCCILKLSKLKN